jgi:hypothetical protein
VHGVARRFFFEGWVCGVLDAEPPVPVCAVWMRAVEVEVDLPVPDLTTVLFCLRVNRVPLAMAAPGVLAPS